MAYLYYHQNDAYIQYYILNFSFFNVDYAIHFIHFHKYNNNSAEDLSDMD